MLCTFTFKIPIFLLKNPYRAIALSLQEAGSKHAVIDLVTDDEDDDSNEDTARFQVEIERAIAASKAESSRQHAAMDVAPSDPQLTVPGASAFLSERAQLEKARLERQKRLRPEASLDDNNYGDDSDDDATVREPPAKRQHLSLSSGSRTNNDSTRPVSSTSNGSTSQHTIDQVFWDGEFRQTATRHADPRKDGRPTFRLTEVLGQVSFK